MVYGKPTICNRQPAILLLHLKLESKIARLCVWVASIHSMVGGIWRRISLFHLRFLWWGCRHDVCLWATCRMASLQFTWLFPLTPVRPTTSRMGSTFHLGQQCLRRRASHGLGALLPRFLRGQGDKNGSLGERTLRQKSPKLCYNLWLLLRHGKRLGHMPMHVYVW